MQASIFSVIGALFREDILELSVAICIILSRKRRLTIFPCVKVALYGILFSAAHKKSRFFNLYNSIKHKNCYFSASSSTKAAAFVEIAVWQMALQMKYTRSSANENCELRSSARKLRIAKKRPLFNSLPEQKVPQSSALL